MGRNEASCLLVGRIANPSYDLTLVVGRIANPSYESTLERRTRSLEAVPLPPRREEKVDKRQVPTMLRSCLRTVRLPSSNDRE